jgi:hypothetical protein
MKLKLLKLSQMLQDLGQEEESSAVNEMAEEDFPETKLDRSDRSDTLFFLKSPWGMERGRFDHVGFVLQDERMKDMSGHRGEMVVPKTYDWKDLLKDDVFWMGWDENNKEEKPRSRQEAIDLGIYKEIKLPKIVNVPSNIVYRDLDESKVSENCGSFVFNILYNSGIDPSFLKSDEYIVVGKDF